MIHGKEGRARFTTATRATVRPDHQWNRGEDELMEGTLRKVKTPDDLVRACEDAGASTRPVSSGGVLVKGPAGVTTIPPQWSGRGRGRANAIAAVRRLGLNLDADLAPPPTLMQVVAVEPEAIYEEQEVEETEMANPARPNPLTALPARKPSATQEDLEATIELIETLSGRISALAARMGKVEKQLAAGIGEPSKYDQAKYVRDRIITWFKQLPPGFLAASGTIISNLEPDADNAIKGTYKGQLAVLVKEGQLRAHGERAATQYSMPVELGSDR